MKVVDPNISKKLITNLQKLKKDFKCDNFRNIVEMDIKSHYKIHNLENDNFTQKKFDFMLKKNQSLVNLIKKGEVFSEEEKQIFRIVRNDIQTFSSVRQILDHYNEKIEIIDKKASIKKYEFLYEFDFQPISSFNPPEKFNSPFLIASCFDLLDIGLNEILRNIFYKENFKIKKIKI